VTKKNLSKACSARKKSINPIKCMTKKVGELKTGSATKSKLGSSPRAVSRPNVERKKTTRENSRNESELVGHCSGDEVAIDVPYSESKVGYQSSCLGIKFDVGAICNLHILKCGNLTSDHINILIALKVDDVEERICLNRQFSQRVDVLHSSASMLKIPNITIRESRTLMFRACHFVKNLTLDSGAELRIKVEDASGRVVCNGVTTIDVSFLRNTKWKIDGWYHIHSADRDKVLGQIKISAEVTLPENYFGSPVGISSNEQKTLEEYKSWRLGESFTDDCALDDLNALIDAQIWYGEPGFEAYDFGLVKSSEPNFDEVHSQMATLTESLRMKLTEQAESGLKMEP